MLKIICPIFNSKEMEALRKNLADWQSQDQAYKPGPWMPHLLFTLSPYVASTWEPFISERILVYLGKVITFMRATPDFEALQFKAMGRK